MQEMAHRGPLWVFEILVGAGVLTFVNLGLKRLIQFVSKRYAKHSHDWRRQLGDILLPPVNLLIWLLALVYVLDIIGHRFGFAAALNYLGPFRSGSIVSCAAWVLLRWKKQLQKGWIAKNQLGQRAIDPGMDRVLGRLTSITVGVITTLIVLQILGLNIVPLLTFCGVGAAAIGFASQGVLTNFFGGLMLHITRPFVIGDAIHLQEKNITGTVEEIGWYLTTLRDEEKRPLFLPNSLFSSLVITNLSRISHRKFLETFTLNGPYLGSSLGQELKRKIEAHAEVDSTLPVEIAQKGNHLSISFYCLETRLKEFAQVKEKFVGLISRQLEQQER